MGPADLAETAAPDPVDIFSVDLDTRDTLIERVLGYQRAFNPIYGRFAEAGRYLPVSAFKLAPVCDFDPEESEGVFRSSGTSGSRSSHFVRHLAMYDRSIDGGFRFGVGEGPFTILVHLPSYAPDSSLVYMAHRLIEQFGAKDSAFLGADGDGIERAQGARAPVLVLGAAFGLLDLVETRTTRLPDDALVIETGGMKTRRRELGRTQLHRRLAEGFGIRRSRIRSEYGMCEMLSQCYTVGGESFRAPPWVHWTVRDAGTPEREVSRGEEGVLAIVDLANLHSASAILTEDRAVADGDGFRVLGRLTGAELRGCNFLMVDA